MTKEPEKYRQHWSYQHAFVPPSKNGRCGSHTLGKGCSTPLARLYRHTRACMHVTILIVWVWVLVLGEQSRNGHAQLVLVNHSSNEEIHLRVHALHVGDTGVGADVPVGLAALVRRYLRVIPICL